MKVKLNHEEITLAIAQYLKNNYLKEYDKFKAELLLVREEGELVTGELEFEVGVVKLLKEETKPAAAAICTPAEPPSPQFENY